MMTFPSLDHPGWAALLRAVLGTPPHPGHKGGATVLPSGRRSSTSS
jgi:hypothetical protein